MGMMMPGRGPRAEINITPMIDVLLVLLIIFMVITPTAPVGLKAAIPPESNAVARPPQPPVVIEVEHGGKAKVNTQPVEVAELAAKLRGIFQGNPTATVFVDGPGDLQYADVARVIDIAKGAGIATIGLMPGKKK